MTLLKLEAQLYNLENKLMNEDLSIMEAYKIKKEIERIEIEIEFEKSNKDKNTPKQWKLNVNA